ncbi:MAG: anaerobic ribonucleoside-triphosphate reductase activating protein [Bacilli bacterium]
MDKIRLASPLQIDSIVDGPGIRAVIWTQGCIHNCLECHNPETHDLMGGYVEDIGKIKKQIEKLELHDGITLSGGDPLEQVSACLAIAQYCQQINKTVWCYTGYTFEQLLAKNDQEIMKFLNNVDVLIDGPFIQKEQSYNIPFRGSKNQRILDVKKSLEQKKAISILKYEEETIKEKKELIFI